MKSIADKSFQEIKLYSPLNAEFVPQGHDSDEKMEDWSGRDLAPYQHAIQAAVETYREDLAPYYDGPETVKMNIIRMLPSVELYKGKLCGCTTIQFREEMPEHLWNRLFDYVQGQYSDGWGEGFEQRDIPVEGGYLNVHFWQSERFEFWVEDVAAKPATEREVLKPRPKMDLMGHDGNIFAIMGRAAKVLRDAGMNRESMEMRRRVQQCDNYYKALRIISEYVETELSVPRDTSRDAKSKSQKEKER